MSLVSNANSVKEWLRKGCPALSGKRIGVDFLAEKATEYSLFSVPSALRYHENILGEEVLSDEQEQNFIFASRMPYSNDVAQNVKNLTDFQEITVWMLNQNAARSFPDWDGGKIDSIVPTLTPTVANASAGAAQYQINIKVSYRLRRS